ncbi:unnamed protein product [Linum trigynum]|uniref:Uncharacterized protein n=1 Tax=Linum trigynum TaxID=586398 RepID=A0AAV2ESY1_9ROSI
MHLLRKGLRSDYTKGIYHGEGDQKDEDEDEEDDEIEDGNGNGDVNMDLNDMLGVLNNLLPPQVDPEP